MDNKLLTSRKIILDMLENRGYKVDDYRNYSINEIRMQKDTGNLDMLLKNGTKTCYVNYNITDGKFKKLKTGDLTKAVRQHFHETEGELTQGDELIIIMNHRLLLSKKYSNFSPRLEKYYHNDRFVQVFDIDSLVFNITEHELVPEHVILSDEEKQDLVTHFNLDEDQLPHISRFDPVAKFIGLRPGDVCKIERKSYSSGKVNYYRICV